MEIMYEMLLFGLRQWSRHELEHWQFRKLYMSQLKMVNSRAKGPKADVFRLAVCCARLHIETSTNKVWIEAARLMRDIIDDGTDDQQIFSLHMLLLPNATYNTAFTAEVTTRPPAEPAVYNDEVLSWTELVDEQVEN